LNCCICPQTFVYTLVHSFDNIIYLLFLRWMKPCKVVTSCCSRLASLWSRYVWTLSPSTDSSCNVCPRLTDKLQVLNKLPTELRHILVPQGRISWPKNINNKNVGISIFLFCVSQPDQREVPLKFTRFNMIMCHVCCIR